MWHLQTTLRLSRRFYPRGAETRPAVLLCTLLTLISAPAQALHRLRAEAGCATLKPQKSYLWCNVFACLSNNFPEEP
jgi:hypothetical protein